MRSGASQRREDYRSHKAGLTWCYQRTFSTLARMHAPPCAIWRRVYLASAATGQATQILRRAWNRGRCLLFVNFGLPTWMRL